MVKTVTFFDNIDDLMKLTGLKTRGDLWAVGFDLDDWDFGFVSDTEWCWGVSRDIPRYEFWLLCNLCRYHCGYRHTEYNGKHYYIAYHS